MSNGASKNVEDKDIQGADDYQIANDGADGVNGCFDLDSSSSKRYLNLLELQKITHITLENLIDKSQLGLLSHLQMKRRLIAL